MNLLFALAASIIIGALFTLGLRRRRQPIATAWFFVILFLGTWALGLWIRPLGPPWWNVRWVPFVLAAGVIALLLAAITPIADGSDRGERSLSATDEMEHTAATRPTNPVDASALALQRFFWVLLGISVAALILHYAITP